MYINTKLLVNTQDWLLTYMLATFDHTRVASFGDCDVWRALVTMRSYILRTRRQTSLRFLARIHTVEEGVTRKEKLSTRREKPQKVPKLLVGGFTLIHSEDTPANVCFNSLSSMARTCRTER